MKRKLPPEAFEYYAGLGLNRSYQAVADHFGVAKVTVTALAKREGWQKRIQDLDARVRKTSDDKLVESMEEVRARHFKAARVIQAKAIEGLRQMSLDRGMDAVRALIMGVRQEQALIGEPAERGTEEIMRRLFDELMRPEGDTWVQPQGGEDGEQAA